MAVLGKLLQGQHLNDVRTSTTVVSLGTDSAQSFSYKLQEKLVSGQRVRIRVRAFVVAAP